MISATPTEKVPLIQVFLSSSVGGAKERTWAREADEKSPEDLLLASGFRFKVGIWDDPACRFLTVVGASGIGKSLLVDAGWSDTLGGARQIR